MIQGNMGNEQRTRVGDGKRRQSRRQLISLVRLTRPGEQSMGEVCACVCVCMCSCVV